MPGAASPTFSPLVLLGLVRVKGRRRQRTAHRTHTCRSQRKGEAEAAQLVENPECLRPGARAGVLGAGAQIRAQFDQKKITRRQRLTHLKSRVLSAYLGVGSHHCPDDTWPLLYLVTRRYQHFCSRLAAGLHLRLRALAARWNILCKGDTNVACLLYSSPSISKKKFGPLSLY